MEFRPCIDIHNGKVKQIVGSSLQDAGSYAVDNFVSEKDAAYYAKFYQSHGIRNGHVILLNGKDSPYYEETKRQALSALNAYRGGLQVGGGITPDNAAEFLDAGASHVIVTSYVFRDGMVDYDRLSQMVKAVGRKQLVLDLSCRRKGDDYFIVTDRWQKFTDVKLSTETMHELASYCDEFLIHAVDVEGKQSGIDVELLLLLQEAAMEIPITYAGGVHTFSDLETIKTYGKGRIHVTIGSALDLFGGEMEFEKVLSFQNGSHPL